MILFFMHKNLKKEIRKVSTNRGESISNIVKYVFFIVIVFTILFFVVSQFLPQLLDSSAGLNSNFVRNSKIVVEDKKLYLNGKEFFVNGVMYVTVKDRPGTVSILNMFSKDAFNKKSVEREMRLIKSYGFNTVRLAYYSNIDGNTENQKSLCRSSTTYFITDCLEKESLDNLVYTIKVAEKNNLKVILSFVGGTPFTYYSSSSFPYDGQNINFLKEETINDYGRFLSDTMHYLKSSGVNFNTFLAIQPYAEPSIDLAGYPFTKSNEILAYPNFYVPLGKKYAVSNLNKKSSEIKEIYQFSVINSYNKWTSDVKSVDSGLIVLFEQFPQYAVKDESRVVLDSTLYSEFIKADLIGMQLYPDYIQKDIASVYNLFENDNDYISLQNHNKPFLVLEYGFLKDSGNAVNHKNDLYIIDSWINQMCDLNIVGISYFNWNADNFNYQTAKANNYLIAKFIKDKQKGICKK